MNHLHDGTHELVAFLYVLESQFI